MALGFSTACANTMFDSGINATFNSGVLELRDGTRPTDADTAPTGTLLASIDLPADAFSAASGGTMALTGTWTEASAPATGNVTWFRLKQTGDLGTTNTTDERIDGNVGTSGSDLNLTTTSIVATDSVTITQFDLSLPA